MKKLLTVMILLTFVGCGRDGADGQQGAQGIPGPIGSTGPVGSTGAPGSNGSGCSVTTVGDCPGASNGGSLIQCSDGSQSLVLNGTNGTNGAAGVAGTAGTPGTLVTSVQFCPGTPSYPSTFPEVGFCISNVLYAVYSANDGFLTVVEPGTWSSNAIGSSCTFTVSANCKVSN